MDFEYFYNREAERFNFLKVPEILVDREEFRGLSAEAIILYSILLKQTGMSFKNNWIDKEGRVFIYPNHSYLSQLDVTYKTPDLMSHFLPP
ncbi:replication initiator protein A, partial [Streptococcus pneumoniae]|nr:replication initiator protein A [Streptococcus pneumoniae]